MPPIGMPDLQVRRLDRSGASPQLPPRLALAVQSYSHAAIGGPDRASIAASGDVSQVWECIEWLRCPIEIVDHQGRPVWWGFVHSVQVQAGPFSFGVSLETMSNTIAVAYSRRSSGTSAAGVRATTAWLADTVSVSTYGTKELLLSGDMPDAVTANAYRAAALASLKYPVPTVRLEEGEQVSATIDCLGWWHTAEWRYFTETPGIVSYTTEGDHATYTSATISFNGASDDIDDSAGGLGVFDVGESLLVTGVDTRGVYTIDGSSGATNLHVAEDLGGLGAGTPATLENHFVTVGHNTAARKIAQSFVVPTTLPLELDTIGIYARTFDNPTSLRLYLNLHADSAGAPGAVLATGANARSEEGFSGNQTAPSAPNETDFISEVAPMSLTTYTMRAPNGAVLALSAGATYWIVLDTDATGGFNGAEFFIVQRNPDGSSDGDLLRWDGSAWQATAGVLLHIVSGTKETTRQIAEIVADVMPFLTGVIVEDDSGMFNSGYRDGDTTAKKELDELLAIGTTAGKRLLATVTRERYLRVYEEPAIGADAHRLGSDGLLKDSLGNPVPAHTCPVGMWVKLVDVIPATADTSVLGSPSPFFVDRTEYNARSNRLRLEPKAAPSPRDIGKVVQG
jgi:hypothetical protein